MRNEGTAEIEPAVIRTSLGHFQIAGRPPRSASISGGWMRALGSRTHPKRKKIDNWAKRGQHFGKIGLPFGGEDHLTCSGQRTGQEMCAVFDA